MNENILKIQNLSLSFGNKTILHNISFGIKRGHIIGLIGANGAGKTTIMKSILGITDFTGRIFINENLVSKKDHQALKSVGALIEYPGLYPYLSGHEQLELFATGNNRKKDVEVIIHKLGMDSYADMKTKNYSLGMKQKLGVGLALLNDPKLVILDEPMNGLDPEATKALRNLIVEEKKHGTTFLISSHILSELQRIADDVIIIDHGQIIKDTTMNDLLSINKSSYQIKTNNDEFAIKLLHQKGVGLQHNSEILIPITNQISINTILKILIDNKIEILNITQKSGDLEESLFKVLSDNPMKLGEN